MRASYRKAVWVTVIAGAAALAALGPERIGSPGRPAAPPAASPQASVAATSPGSADEKAAPHLALPERPALGSPAGALFGPAAPPAPPPKVAAAPPPPPQAPPMPYRFAGRVVHRGKTQVFLTKGEHAIPVREGETLDGSYRVESITAEGIVLLYLPLNKKESIPLAAPVRAAGIPGEATASVAPPAATAGAAGAAPSPAIGSIPIGTVVGTPARAPDPQQKISEPRITTETKGAGRPARLLWDGPAEVKSGAQFSVALRLTSDEPVRASPVQLRFDPKLLESVTVKPGRFYGNGDRNFNYRVNPEGSIFIGASSPGSASAADAELFVLTFRTIKPAAVAELSIAALNLQGAAGRAIAFDSLGAFKTVITP